MTTITVPRHIELAIKCLEEDPVQANAINNALAWLRAALAQQAEPTPPHKLVQEWARTHHVRFVNRSSGLYSTDTVGLEGLCALVEMARATTPKENSNG